MRWRGGAISIGPWWREAYVAGESRLVETHMSRLRTKLNEGGRGDAIRTVRGSGYMVLSSGTAQGIIEGDYVRRMPVVERAASSTGYRPSSTSCSAGLRR